MDYWARIHGLSRSWPARDQIDGSKCRDRPERSTERNPADTLPRVSRNISLPRLGPSDRERDIPGPLRLNGLRDRSAESSYIVRELPGGGLFSITSLRN